MASSNQPLNGSPEITLAALPDNIQIFDLGLQEIADLVIFDLSNPKILNSPQKMMEVLENAYRKTRRVRTQRRMDGDLGIKP